MSHVYFVTAPDHLGRTITKIGHTTNDVRNRVSAMQSGSPVLLTLVGSLPGNWRTEARIHTLYAQHRLHGEWFDFAATPEFIDSLRLHLDAEKERERRARSQALLSTRERVQEHTNEQYRKAGIRRRPAGSPKQRGRG